MHVCMHMPVCGHVYVWMCAFVCMHVCACVCMHIYCICVWVNFHLHTFACKGVWVQVCIYVKVCMYMFISVYTHAYMLSFFIFLIFQLQLNSNTNYYLSNFCETNYFVLWTIPFKILKNYIKYPSTLIIKIDFKRNFNF